MQTDFEMRSTRFQHQERFFHFASQIHDSGWQKYDSAQRWQLLKMALKQLREKEPDTLWISAVMMGTHFHLLFSTQKPHENILMHELERRLSEMIHGPAAIFETPVLCEQILSLAQFRQTYRYIYRNPIEAQLCQRAQEYRWSSLYELLNSGAESLFIDCNGLIQNPFAVLQWLNSEPSEAGLQSRFLT